jgi:hypothetical protein
MVAIGIVTEISVLVLEPAISKMLHEWTLLGSSQRRLRTERRKMSEVLLLAGSSERIFVRM